MKAVIALYNQSRPVYTCHLILHAIVQTGEKAVGKEQLFAKSLCGFQDFIPEMVVLPHLAVTVLCAHLFRCVV